MWGVEKDKVSADAGGGRLKSMTASGSSLRPDRAGGRLNLYSYVPNPLTWIDPLDLSKCSAGKPPTAYSTAYEIKVSNTSYPGVSRGRHFQEATNRY